MIFWTKTTEKDFNLGVNLPTSDCGLSLIFGRTAGVNDRKKEPQIEKEKGLEESGNGTVRALSIIFVLVVITFNFMVLSKVFRLVETAQTGLDIAVLAGAQVLIDSYGASETASVCDVVGNLATVNGVNVSSCKVVGLDVFATSRVTKNVGPFPISFTVKSRAGVNESKAHLILVQ